MTHCLFIGGSLDGRWIGVAEGCREFRVPRLRDGWRESRNGRPDNWDDEVYEARRLVTNSGELHTVFIGYTWAGDTKRLNRLLHIGPPVTDVSREDLLVLADRMGDEGNEPMQQWLLRAARELETT